MKHKYCMRVLQLLLSSDGGGIGASGEDIQRIPQNQEQRKRVWLGAV